MEKNKESIMQYYLIQFQYERYNYNYCSYEWIWQKVMVFADDFNEACFKIRLQYSNASYFIDLTIR